MENNEEGYIYYKYVDAHSIRASSYEVVDSNGVLRMKLYTTSDGTPVIDLLDPNQQSAITLSLDDNARGWIGMFNANGTRQFELAISDKGLPRVRLFDTRDQVRIAVTVGDNGPALNMYDNTGQLRASVHLKENGKPAIELTNAEAQRQALITVPADGSEGLVFKDREGTAKSLVL